jgi:hypothetical protein
MPPAIPNVSSQQAGSVFYFYNPTTVALKIRIQKIWGDRSPKGNWRITTSALNTVASDSLTDGGESL